MAKITVYNSSLNSHFDRSVAERRNLLVAKSADGDSPAYMAEIIKMSRPRKKCAGGSAI